MNWPVYTPVVCRPDYTPVVCRPEYTPVVCWPDYTPVVCRPDYTPVVCRPPLPGVPGDLAYSTAPQCSSSPIAVGPSSGVHQGDKGEKNKEGRTSDPQNYKLSVVDQQKNQ